MLKVKFIYNNARNISISYIFFELDHNYYSYILYKKYNIMIT